MTLPADVSEALVERLTRTLVALEVGAGDQAARVAELEARVAEQDEELRVLREAATVVERRTRLRPAADQGWEPQAEPAAADL